ncbi:MAG: hypothetical protein KGY42_03195 [Desulfobacterales bacterium]|nr:hypothetical protein [Desulfobacterales bacterium]
MLTRIYGTGSEMLVEKVKKANPGLADPNRIQSGRKINFPVMGKSSVPRQQHYWIACQKSDNLNRIYQFVYAGKSRDLRVLSFWDPSAGLQHAAVYRVSYAEYRDAKQALSNKNGIHGETAAILDLSKDGLRLLTGIENS